MISSTIGGFIPTKADLIEKDSRLYPILSLFLGLPDRIRTYDLASRSRMRYPSTLQAVITRLFYHFSYSMSIVFCLLENRKEVCDNYFIEICRKDILWHWRNEDLPWPDLQDAGHDAC